MNRMTKRITTLEEFPNWCKKRDIDLRKCTKEQWVQFFLYFNARCAERMGIDNIDV